MKKGNLWNKIGIMVTKTNALISPCHLSHMAWKTNGLLLSHCSISLSNADLFKTASNIGLPNICGELLNVQIWSLGHGLWGCFSWSTAVRITWAFLLTWRMHFNVCAWLRGISMSKSNRFEYLYATWMIIHSEIHFGPAQKLESQLMGYHFSDLTAQSLKPISVLDVTL